MATPAPGLHSIGGARREGRARACPRRQRVAFAQPRACRRGRRAGADAEASVRRAGGARLRLRGCLQRTGQAAVLRHRERVVALVVPRGWRRRRAARPVDARRGGARAAAGRARLPLTLDARRAARTRRLADFLLQADAAARVWPARQRVCGRPRARRPAVSGRAGRRDALRRASDCRRAPPRA
eukprot:2454398-Pleurochrysis_carterae.AAC.2